MPSRRSAIGPERFGIQRKPCERGEVASENCAELRAPAEELRAASRAPHLLEDLGLCDRRDGVVDAEEDGDLRERRQAAGERVDLLVLEEAADLHVEDLLVVAVPLADQVLLRLDRLHVRRARELVPVERQRHQLHAEHEAEDRDAVRERDAHALQRVAQPEDPVLHRLDVRAPPAEVAGLRLQRLHRHPARRRVDRELRVRRLRRLVRHQHGGGVQGVRGRRERVDVLGPEQRRRRRSTPRERRRAQRRHRVRGGAVDEEQRRGEGLHSARFARDRRRRHRVVSIELTALAGR